MGQFSWLDCKTEEQIIDDRVKNVYVLVPEEFEKEYGKRIEEPCYDGYGHFGGYDIFELVALWNRKYLSLKNIDDITTSDYCMSDFDFYKNGLKNQIKTVDRLVDFKNNVSNMKQKYGNEYLREIGIDIACYDKQQDELMYPIKITYDKTATYDDCGYSLSDPNQGWEIETDYEDED